MNTVDLLLMGKTGNGKSATGNSILNRKVFRSVASTSLVTRQIQYNYSEYVDGCILKVVDTPGFMDSDVIQSDTLSRIDYILNKALFASPSGYDAILYVVAFNGQFTKEELQVMTTLDNFFGENFVKKHCILVMTHGDNYDIEENGNFTEWCANQEGKYFKELFDLCDRRIVLFDNKTKDEYKRKDQLETLFKILDTTSKDLSLNKNKNFQQNQERKKTIKGDPLIKEEVLKESSLIVQKLGQIDLSDTEKQISSLENLKIRAENLFQKIRSQDNNTGNLRDYIGNAINIKSCAKDQHLSAQDAGEFKREKARLQGEIKRMKQNMKSLHTVVNEEDERKRKEKSESNLGETSVGEIEMRRKDEEAEDNELRRKEQEVEEYDEMIKLMELRLKEDASKVEEENSELIYDWLAEQTSDIQSQQTRS